MGFLFIILGITVGALTIVGTTRTEAHQAVESGVIEQSQSYLPFNICINIAILLLMIGLYQLIF